MTPHLVRGINLGHTIATCGGTARECGLNLSLLMATTTKCIAMQIGLDIIASSLYCGTVDFHKYKERVTWKEANFNIQPHGHEP